MNRKVRADMAATLHRESWEQYATIAEKKIAELETSLATERERCAKIAENQFADPAIHNDYRTAGQVIAAAIRNSNK